MKSVITEAAKKYISLLFEKQKIIPISLSDLECVYRFGWVDGGVASLKSMTEGLKK